MLLRMMMAANSGAPVLWTPAQLNAYGWYNDDSIITQPVPPEVSDWQNLGSGNSWSQGNNDRRPAAISSAINSRRALRFTPADDRMVISLDPAAARNLYRNTQHGYCFAVYKKTTDDASNTVRCLLSVTNGVDLSSRFVCSIGNTANTPALFVRRLDADSTGVLNATAEYTGVYTMALWKMNWGTGVGQIHINGSLNNSNTLTSTGSTSDTGAYGPMVLAAYPSDTAASTVANPADLELADMVMGNTSLSTDDIDKLFGYAAHRYDLTSLLPALHPYKTTAPTL